MQLVPWQEYAIKAAQFVEQNALQFYRWTLFVSSEDPSVFEDFKSISELLSPDFTTDTWTVFYSNIHRINGGPHEQLTAFGRRVMMHEWLLQLLMALECDAFVGTAGSNWNRLIAELRCIWIDRCDTAYLEVGPRKDSLVNLGHFSKVRIFAQLAGSGREAKII